MATSDTVSTTVFNTRRVIDRAFGRCKVPPQSITAERIEIARDNLFLLLSSLVNRGIPLWTQEQVILPLYQGQARIEAPLGTNDLHSVNIRSLSRVSGTSTSSAGGTVASAFDDDFSTALTQTSSDGDVQTEFTSATLVTTVGILPNAAGSMDLLVERSSDGVSWTMVLDIGAVTHAVGTWVWYDLDGNIAATYIRIRETGGGTIDVQEIFWGNNPTEVPMARLNQDNYLNLPNKVFPGRPLQFWFNRRRGDSGALPELHTWPVCALANRYDQLVAWRKRYLQDVGTLQQEIEVPQRWYAWVVAELAAMLAGELPEVSDSREVLLINKAVVVLSEAQGEERDDSPFFLTPGLGVYTR